MSIKTTQIITREHAIDRILEVHRLIIAKRYRTLKKISFEGAVLEEYVSGLYETVRCMAAGLFKVEMMDWQEVAAKHADVTGPSFSEGYRNADEVFADIAERMRLMSVEVDHLHGAVVSSNFKDDVQDIADIVQLPYTIEGYEGDGIFHITTKKGGV